MLSPHSHMKIRVMPKTTESIRNLCKSTLYLFLTFVSPFILYRCIRFLSMYSSSSTSAPKTDAEILRRKRIEKSKLYFDITTPKVPIIYSSYYDIRFFGIEKLHPFDSSKWDRIRGFLISEGHLDKNSIVEPFEASTDDLLVVPPLAILPNWLVRMKVLSPFRRQVGGTILAAKLAKEQGWAINVGGGFHHCSSGRGGGFCAYADISLCIHFAFFRFTISRVMIIDLDAHQGNGHEMDFAGDGRVYILDMYNPDIYPFDLTARNYIKQKVEVATGTTTDGYLKELDKALRVARDNFAPELIIYNAGTDILDGDPLGGLKISPDGVAQRDEKVFRFARERNIPLVMVTSGGYMKTSARVVADSIINLSRKRLIDLSPRYGRR
ncbi:histone deacetylase 2-like isoform X2 [Durio zibethinus]|uniref:Histone deacetylase 2-like isoform X2 n=1 Tax=Durio zibethinus TaxID=66656 RepID=A0A6P5XWZ7_DURZI|nr:histone deacetylase 2-like isoform X2 [Durio zibethinus]